MTKSEGQGIPSSPALWALKDPLGSQALRGRRMTWSLPSRAQLEYRDREQLDDNTKNTCSITMCVESAP